MTKGIQGLAYLPKVDIRNDSTIKCSIRACRDALARLEKFQSDRTQGITLSSITLLSSQPYFNSTWELSVGSGVVASAQFEFNSVVAGDTIEINGLLYTGVDGAKSDNTEFSVDTDDTSAATDITDSIDNDDRTGGFGAIDASSSINVVDLDQTTTGTAGNNTEIDTGSSTITINDVFAGGLDPSLFRMAFISETYLQADSIPPMGYTTKRPLEIDFTGVTIPFTFRSLISVINWIERTSEVKVSSKGLGTQATATVTLATALALDTVTINGLVYTAVAGTKSDNTEFSIDGTDTVDAADLADSVLNDTRAGTLQSVGATSSGAIVTLSSGEIGAVGNDTTLVSSDGVTLAVSGALFTGGADSQDGTFTNAVFKGATPYLTHIWTVVKLGDVYTLTSTADS